MTPQQTPNSSHSSEEFVQVAVPRSLYPRVLRILADAMAEQAHVPQPDLTNQNSAGKRDGPWTAEEVRRLRPLIAKNPTAFTLMEMTCANPGVRVSFKDVKVQAGRKHGDARADLASLSRITSHRLNRDHWTVHVEKGPDGSIVYDASPEVAAAWKNSQ
jgi:hypothetical protein